MNIAIVIPTLNEAAHLPALLERFRDHPTPPIVADCGSVDRTVPLARAAGAEVVGGAELPDRATALNAGTILALERRPAPDVLWFVHADSVPPADWAPDIARCLADERVVGGAFDFAWTPEPVNVFERAGLGFARMLNRARLRVTRCHFGDQGIFVRTGALQRIGGVPAAPIMEDVLLCRRLRSVGRVGLARGIMHTSPRRLLRHGPLRQTLIDMLLLLGESCGMDLPRAAAWYNGDNRRPLSDAVREAAPAAADPRAALPAPALTSRRASSVPRSS